MDLWVRAQNKKALFKCHTLLIEPFRQQFRIYSNEYGTIGKYDTEQRCLEILDEIQAEIEKANSNILIWQNSEHLQENEMKEINEQLQKYSIISIPNGVKTEFMPKGSRAVIYQMPEK